MVLKAHEAVIGIRHFRYKLERSLLRRTSNFHLKKLNTCTMPYAELHNPDGQPSLCETCGYAMVRVQMPSGWLLEMCSAMPIVNFGKAEFWRWQCELSTSTTASNACTNDQTLTSTGSEKAVKSRV